MGSWRHDIQWDQVGRYVIRQWIAHDQLLNVMLGGDPDETLSFRANRARSLGKLWGRAL